MGIWGAERQQGVKKEDQNIFWLSLVLLKVIYIHISVWEDIFSMTTLFLSFFFHNTSQKQIWKASNDLSNNGINMKTCTHIRKIIRIWRLRWWLHQIRSSCEGLITRGLYSYLIFTQNLRIGSSWGCSKKCFFLKERSNSTFSESESHN